MIHRLFSATLFAALVGLSLVPPTTPDTHEEDRTVCYYEAETNSWLSEYTNDGLCQFTANPTYK